MVSTRRAAQLRSVIGVDFGTSGTRAFRINENGNVLAEARRPSPVIEDHKTGYLGQSMPVSAKAGLSAIKELMEKTGHPETLVGLATSGWMHGDVLLDENGKPLDLASMWNCPRSNPQWEKIMSDPDLVNLFIEETGNEPFARMTLVKTLHRKEEQPDLWARTETVVTPKDYWNFVLTGALAQEDSDIIGAVDRNGEYSTRLINALRIANKFAPLCRPTTQIGTLKDTLARKTGLPKGLPVFAGGGDQQCGRIGNGVVSKGIAGFNLGSSGVTTAYNPKGKADPSGQIHYFGDWLMACCMASGDSWKWFSEQMNAGKTNRLSMDDLNKLAMESPAGSNGVRFLPFLSGANHPIRDPQIRGAFLRLTMGTKPSDLARAVKEAVAVEMVLCAKQMMEFGIDIDEARLAGGGATDKTGLWPQMFADALGRPVTLNNVSDASGLGAAIIAMVGAQVYPDYKTACDKMISWGKTFTPGKDQRAYQAVTGDYRHYHGRLSNLEGKDEVGDRR